MPESDSDRDKGLRLVREMIPGTAVDFDRDFDGGDFVSEMAELSLANVFGRLWTRDGLDRRSRSLVTLGILITLGATEELEIHLAVALHNGLTRRELEEVLYHASGYAGFPRATIASRVAQEFFAQPAGPGDDDHVGTAHPSEGRR